MTEEERLEELHAEMRKNAILYGVVHFTPEHIGLIVNRIVERLKNDRR